MRSPASADPDHFFRVDHLHADLRGRSVRGGAASMGGQAGKFILMLAGTPILARILSPEEFGLIAMLMSVIGFVATFKDLGLSMATVQRAEINHEQVSTLFWINVLVGAGAMALIASLSSVFAWFYHEPRLVNINIALAGTVLFSSLTVQHQAILRRQMRFGALAFNEVFGLFVATVIAVVAALAGASYWALVLLYVCKEISVMVGVWVLCRWRPGRAHRDAGVRELLAFGGNLTAFNMVNYFARYLDKVLIGWKWGVVPVGLYNKAYQLLLLPMQQINAPLTGVAVPALSRLQDDPPRYRAYYRRAMLMVESITAPAVILLFVAAPSAVRVLLGDQWMDAVPLFRALGPAALVGTFSVAMGWVYLSMGTTHRQLRFGVFASLVMIAGMFVGLPWGARGVALAVSACLVGLLFVGVPYCFRGSHLSLGDLLSAVWRPLVGAFAAGAAVWFAAGRLALGGNWLELLVSVGMYVVFYFLAWLVLPGGRLALREVLQIVRELRPQRTASD